MLQIQIVDWLFYDNGKRERTTLSHLKERGGNPFYLLRLFPSCLREQRMITLRMHSLSESKWRAWLHPVQDITHFMATTMILSHIVIHGQAVPLGSPEGTLMRYYLKVSLVLGDGGVNLRKLAASHR